MGRGGESGTNAIFFYSSMRWVAHDAMHCIFTKYILNSKTFEKTF